MSGQPGSDLYEFWAMTSIGEPQGSEAPRAFGFWNLSYDIARSLCCGGAPADWPADAAIELEPGSPAEDAIWAGLEAIPVSDRLRRWLQEQAPGQAVFLPIAVKGFEASTAPSYWIMTPAAAIDCLDRLRTVDWISRVIDEAKVDPGLDVFRAVGDIQCTILVRDRLRRSIEAAGFSGLLFSPVQHKGLVRLRWERRKGGG